MKRPKHDTRYKGPQGSNAVPRGVIIHSTESDQQVGPSDRHGIVDFLANSRGLSVPVVIDDEGMTEMVPQPHHGIHAASISDCHGIEQIGRAGWSRKQWLEHRQTIVRSGQECAWFLAEKMGLPVTKETLKRFVVGHADDHRFGGTSDHWDPGPNFPWDVLREAAIAYARAKGYKIVVDYSDTKRIRYFTVPKRRQMWAYVRKQLKRGRRVVIQRKKLRADLED